MAMPNMPMPSAKRGAGITSEAMVAVAVLLRARDAPCTILNTKARNITEANM